MDYPALLSFGATILGITGAAVGFHGKLSSRFSELEKEIISNRGEINLLKASIAETKEDIQVYHSAHKEMVEHARNRFFAEFTRFENHSKTEIENQKRLVAEVRQFLAKKTDFELRDYKNE